MDGGMEGRSEREAVLSAGAEESSPPLELVAASRPV